MCRMQYELNALSVVPAFFYCCLFLRFIFFIILILSIVSRLLDSEYWESIHIIWTVGWYVCACGWSLSDLIKIVIMWHCSIEPIGIWEPLYFADGTSAIRYAYTYVVHCTLQYEVVHLRIVVTPDTNAPFSITFQLDYVLMMMIKKCDIACVLRFIELVRHWGISKWFSFLFFSTVFLFL